MFNILKINSGWFDFTIKPGRYHFTSSDYLGYDFLNELLLALVDLSNKKEKTTVIAIHDEPYAYMVYLTRNHNSINVQIYEAKNDSCTIDMNNLINEETTSNVLDFKEEFLPFVKSVIHESERWFESIGYNGFLDHWFEYPKTSLQKLKQANNL